MRPIVRRILGIVPAGASKLVHRHSAAVRLSHWLNALCIVILFMSGLQIFNAHPALYWGKSSDFDHPILSLTAEQTQSGDYKGITQIGAHRFNTTGVLGASEVDGMLTPRGFPAWITLPGPQWLAMGRQWHFAFAWMFAINGLLFVGWALWRGHARHDLLPTRTDLKHLPREVVDHLKLKFPRGEAARHYNALQKLAYVVVIFGLGPLVLLTGLTMSPTMDAAFPQLLWVFGGRQSARTIHFICAFSFFGFFLVHIAMVILSGTWNNLRSMITGRYAIEDEAHD
jgi:thiosulfate reductase cytochrome b subunit